MDLLRAVNQRDMQLSIGNGTHQLRFVQAVRLLSAAAHKVTLIGTFQEALGRRKEHLNSRRFALTLGRNTLSLNALVRQPDVAERVGETTATLLEKSAYGFERTESLGAG